MDLPIFPETLNPATQPSIAFVTSVTTLIEDAQLEVDVPNDALQGVLRGPAVHGGNTPAENQGLGQDQGVP
jgi:hypothetical protein